MKTRICLEVGDVRVERAETDLPMTGGPTTSSVLYEIVLSKDDKGEVLKWHRILG